MNAEYTLPDGHIVKTFEEAYAACKSLARRIKQAVTFTSDRNSSFTVDDNGNLA